MLKNSRVKCLSLKSELEMEQIHKRFATEQVKVLLKGYCQGTLDRPAIEETFWDQQNQILLLPDATREASEVRIWWNNRIVHSGTYPLKELPKVHFSGFSNIIPTRYCTISCMSAESTLPS